MSDIILANQDIVKVDRKIQTDIFNYSSSEFFINMKESDIPPKGHPDRADFIKREREKCRIGLTVGGVYIPGNLYFHFNHFYLIGDDGEDESGRTLNAAKVATLRDNDWIIHTEYARAVKEKKGYCLASSRQIGKDLLNSSILYQKDKETTIGEIKVGDEIYGDDGKLTKVVGVYPQGKKPVYKIKFEEGSIVYAGGEHLWKLWDRHYKQYTIKTTLEWLECPARYSVDLCSPIEYFKGATIKERETLIEQSFIKKGIIKNNIKIITFNDRNVRDIFVDIARSLGNHASSIDKKTHKTYYELHINLDKVRKKVISIEYVFDDETTCIEVDNNSHLFLINDFTITHNTTCLTALTLREVSLYENAEALLIFGNLPDKQSFTKKIKVAIEHGQPFIIRTPIDKDWSNKTEIRFGYTNKDNTTVEKARIFLYNVDGGTDSQKGAGKSLTLFLMDEIGKYDFQPAWEAVEPALKGKNGYRSAPYFSWTGGETEKAKNAFKFTLNPEASNLLKFETEGKKTSKVMFATYRQDCKIQVPLTTFLDNENIKYDKKNQDLKTLKIEVSNVEEATKRTLEELEDKKKDKDPKAALMHRAYYPLCLKDILAKETKNNFNKEFIDQQLEYLKDVGYDKVEVFRDIKTGEVKHKFSFAPVIEDWRKPNFLDTPVKIWDFPKHTEFGVHVIGLDGYRENETLSSDSLGYFTVLRRLHSDLEDPFRGKQVASWLGRKKTVKEMLQLLLDVAEWYNAQILYEHVDRSVLDFFEAKRKLHLLIDTVPLQKEISIKTKTKNNKGLRPTVGNKQFLLNSTLGWVNEELEDESLGYSRIMDEVLLNQLAEYDPEENLDCYIGFSHAVAAYNYFEKFGVPQVEDSNKKQITSNKKPVIYNAFGIPYNKNKKNAFGF